jgi:hypothetical protein
MNLSPCTQKMCSLLLWYTEFPVYSVYFLCQTIELIASIKIVSNVCISLQKVKRSIIRKQSTAEKQTRSGDLHCPDGKCCGKQVLEISL